jgi:hypothetical protein
MPDATHDQGLAHLGILLPALTRPPSVRVQWSDQIVPQGCDGLFPYRKEGCPDWLLLVFCRLFGRAYKLTFSMAC